jgi:hypothetical protein
MSTRSRRIDALRPRTHTQAQLQMLNIVLDTHIHIVYNPGWDISRYKNNVMISLYNPGWDISRYKNNVMISLYNPGWDISKMSKV